MLHSLAARGLTFGLLVSLLPLAGCGQARDEAAAVEESSGAPKEFTVVTYNVENLFDADGLAAFNDYVESDAAHTYSPRHVLNKLRGVSATLKTFNNGQGPEVIAFNEIEMDFSPDSKVADYPAFLGKYQDTTVEKMLTTGLNDEIRGLPAEALLLKHLADEGMTGYAVAIGEDKPDLKALTGESTGRVKAQKNVLFSKFPIASQRSHPTEDARDILETELSVDGQPFYIFVNHWKSGASSTESEQTRRANARTLRERLDQLFAVDPAADILVAGDFNSQYDQSQAYPFMGETAVNDILGSQGDELATATATNYSLYNLWYELPLEERKSDHFRGNWGTLMQKMISPGLYDFRGVQYVDNSFEVVILDGHNAHTPLQIPKRWSNAAGGSGVSDHFPVAARLRVVPDDEADRRKELLNPGTEEETSEPLRVGFEDLTAGQVPVFTAAMASQPGAYDGGIYLIRGKVTVENPLTVEVAGQPFRLWSRDLDLRKHMQTYPEGAEVEFLGELGMHRGNWQFLVHDPGWLIKEPVAPQAAGRGARSATP